MPRGHEPWGMPSPVAAPGEGRVQILLEAPGQRQRRGTVERLKAEEFGSGGGMVTIALHWRAKWCPRRYPRRETRLL